MCSGCPATPALAPTLSLTGLGSTHTGETSPCGIGRCPTCSGFMQKAAGGGGGLTVAAGIDECGVCHQARPSGGAVGLPLVVSQQCVRE